MQVLNFVSHAYFYFIWFFAQFPDLFIWLYPFCLIQSIFLKVCFGCFRLVLGQIYKSLNWFYELLVFLFPKLANLSFLTSSHSKLPKLVLVSWISWSNLPFWFETDEISKSVFGRSNHWFPGLDCLGRMSNLPHFWLEPVEILKSVFGRSKPWFPGLDCLELNLVKFANSPLWFSVLLA